MALGTLDIGRVLRAARYSYAGLRTAVWHHTAFRQELILGVILAPIAIWLGEDGLQRAMLVGSLTLALIVENPTAGIVKFLTFFPLTSPLVVLQRLRPGAIEPWEVAVSLVVLALSVGAVLFLVSRIFRAFLLSYGKRPGPRMLLRALVRG